MKRWIRAAKLLPMCVLLAAALVGAAKVPEGGRSAWAGTAVQPLPNYTGETLPLGLLMR